MGQGMALLFPHLWKEDEPDSHAPIKYDPQFGFEGRERKVRVPRATEEELDSANIEPIKRDFCAFYRMHWRGCVREYAPFTYKCRGFYNELQHCLMDERLFDMKEFEREKRLNARERRIREAAN